MSIPDWTKAKKFHHSVLLVGIIASVVVFNFGMELVSAGIITVSIVLMALTNRFFDGPVYDERGLEYG